MTTQAPPTHTRPRPLYQDHAYNDETTPSFISSGRHHIDKAPPPKEATPLPTRPHPECQRPRPLLTKVGGVISTTQSHAPNHEATSPITRPHPQLCDHAPLFPVAAQAPPTPATPHPPPRGHAPPPHRGWGVGGCGSISGGRGQCPTGTWGRGSRAGSAPPLPGSATPPQPPSAPSRSSSSSATSGHRGAARGQHLEPPHRDP